jgi:hypothetical protein
MKKFSDRINRIYLFFCSGPVNLANLVPSPAEGMAFLRRKIWFVPFFPTPVCWLPTDRSKGTKIQVIR